MSSVEVEGRNIEALQQLRRVIEAAPEDRLHMKTWSELASCGTAYCAAGWAAIDPWFQQNTAILEIFALERVHEERNKGSILVELREGRGDAFLALANIFRIGEEDANRLFGGDLTCWAGPHDVTKAEVLQRIDALIAGQDIEPYAAVKSQSEESHA